MADRYVIVDAQSGDVKGTYDSKLEADYTLATDMRQDYGAEAEGWIVGPEKNWVGVFNGASFGH